VGSNTKLTMIAGARQFSIGKLSVRKASFSNSNNSDETAESDGQEHGKCAKAEIPRITFTIRNTSLVPELGAGGGDFSIVRRFARP